MISVKEKAIYSVFIVCPALYRLFRIANDPTMLQWEKTQRAKHKTGKDEKET